MEALEYFNFIFGESSFDTVHHLGQDGTQSTNKVIARSLLLLEKILASRSFKVKEKKLDSLHCKGNEKLCTYFLQLKCHFDE